MNNCYRLILFTTLALWHCVTAIAEESDARITAADELFDAGLFSQALTLYSEIDNDKNSVNDSLLHSKIQFQLAQVNYAMGQTSLAIDLLEKNTPAKEETALKEIRAHSLYLLAMAYTAQNRYSEALQMILTFLQEVPSASPLYEDALFQKGLIFYHQGNFIKAKEHLKQAIDQIHSPHLNALSLFYISRIEISQGRYKEAHETLDLFRFNADALAKNPLVYEFYSIKAEASFKQNDYIKAADYFEKSLPKTSPEKCNWYSETLYHLGWCFLKIGEHTQEGSEKQQALFQQAEAVFQTLIAKKPEDKFYLALAQCYLTQANILKQEEPYEKVQALLSQPNLFISENAKAQVLLLKAEAAPTYEQRDKFYRQLTEGSESETQFAACGWFKRGLNDFENSKGGKETYDRAAVHFQKAFTLYDDKRQAATALKYQALATSLGSSNSAIFEAYKLLDNLLNNHSEYWMTLEHPEEILYLHGFFASQLANTDPSYLSIADHSLNAAASFPETKFGDVALCLLGATSYRNQDYIKAEAAYLQLVEKFPSSPFCGEAWYWAASCADKLLNPETAVQDAKKEDIGKERRRIAFEKFPQSPYSPEAFFTFYSFRDYLQGDKAAIKHLHAFIEKYPESPFLIEAYYLLGLDFKRDRKTPEGKWISKKNLNEAIGAFQEAENHFATFIQQGKIPSDKLDYYISVKYRTTLERAKANLAIAAESQGAKRQIYLEYAEEVFKNIIEECNQGNHPYAQSLFVYEEYPQILEESHFWLAQTYLKQANDKKAQGILTEMVKNYRAYGKTKGYMLSRVWYELGTIAFAHPDYAKALELLKSSEEASKGNVLSTDQRLDLWIQQARCFQGLQQYDDAILILSKVVNDNAISSLRVKAMFLRAEVYELQKRPELARKQLESLTKKGGIWASKAQEKLEKDYGY